MHEANHTYKHKNYSSRIDHFLTNLLGKNISFLSKILPEYDISDHTSNLH